jgi:hypothetical protein
MLALQKAKSSGFGNKWNAEPSFPKIENGKTSMGNTRGTLYSVVAGLLLLLFMAITVRRRCFTRVRDH